MFSAFLSHGRVPLFKKVLVAIFVLASFSLTLFAASNSIVKKKTPPQAKTYAPPALPKRIAASKGAIPMRDWTVIYYLDADNNLEPDMLNDVNEMEMIGSTDNVNLVALLDRNPGYDNRDGNWSNSKLLYIMRDSSPDKIESKVVTDLKEEDMANPETLAKFIAYAMSNFPAQHYALVLGDHGGSWFNSLNDETNNQGGLKLKDLDAALGTVMKSGGTKFDLMVFDMCLMSQLEVMDTISQYANYAVASEELEPGAGYPNHRVLYALTKNPKIPARDLAQVLVDEWSKSYAQVGDDTVTSAAIDLSKIPAVVDAVDQMAQALSQSPESLVPVIGTARVQAQHFPGNEEGELNSYDIGSFASSLAAQPEAASLKPVLDKVVAAVNGAVIKHAEAAAHQGATGLTIYFPFDKNVAPDYQTVKLTRTHWDEFISGKGGQAAAQESGITMEAVDHQKVYPLGDGVDVKATIKGNPAAVFAAVAYMDPDSGETVLVSNEEVPSPDERWKDGDTVEYRFEQDVRAISDGKTAVIAPLFPMTRDKKFAIGKASYNSMRGDITAGPVFDLTKGELETVFCYSEDGASNPTEAHPIKGEKLVFYQIAFPKQGEAPELRPVKPLTISTTLKLVKSGLPKGKYALVLVTLAADGQESGRDAILAETDGSEVAQNVEYPDYGYPSVTEDDVDYVDLQQIIGPTYDHFEGTWDDYNAAMDQAESDDFDSDDLQYLDDVEVSDEEANFDEEDFSSDYSDDEEIADHDQGDEEDNNGAVEEDNDQDNDHDHDNSVEEDNDHDNDHDQDSSVEEDNNHDNDPDESVQQDEDHDDHNDADDDKDDDSDPHR